MKAIIISFKALQIKFLKFLNLGYVSEPHIVLSIIVAMYPPSINKNNVQGVNKRIDKGNLPTKNKIELKKYNKRPKKRNSHIPLIEYFIESINISFKFIIPLY